jgi:hypothetical protein
MMTKTQRFTDRMVFMIDSTLHPHQSTLASPASGAPGVRGDVTGTVRGARDRRSDPPPVLSGHAASFTPY